MLQTPSDEIIHLEELAATHRRRLHVLERQIAQFGLNVPAHIVLDRTQAEQDLAKILADLRRLRPSIPGERAPYLGLQTFQERDSDLFFGREALIATLVANVERSPFLAVLGASGSGKSSVVRAGLIPELKAGGIPGSEHWRYAILKPGVHPLDVLATALARLQGGDLGSALTLSRQLATSDRALLVAADLLLDGQAEGRLVLVVDQAEELWTLAPGDPPARRAFVEEQQRPFIQLLLTAAESAKIARQMPILIVLTMRADFLHRAAEHPDLARWIGEHDVIVSPLVSDELHRAILGPADVLGGGFEPGLVDALVEAVQGEPGALPLLEYTLLELWKTRQFDGTMTWAAFRELGGVEGALARRADAILAEQYTPEQRDDLRRLLLRLVQPGEGTADTRRRMTLTDLAPAGQAVEAVQALLAPLVEARLLTTGRDAASGAETVEVAHEALLRAWPRLAGWIDEARADLRLQLQVEDAASAWEASGRSADFLWSGLRLASAEAWVERAQPQLNVRDQEFLVASRALQSAQETQRRRAARFRRGALGAIAALIIALLSFGWWSARREVGAQQAQLDNEASLRLADLAQNQKDELSDVPVLLAYESATRRDSPQSVRALHSALNRPAYFVSALTGHTGAIGSAVFSPDGQRILTASADTTARVWDLSGKELVTLASHTGVIVRAEFSPDGQRIVTASADQTARVWDLTGKPLQTLSDHTDRLVTATFSPDGQRILTASADKTARVWDLSGKLLTTLSGHTGPINSAMFSPDGQRIVTASADMTARVWDLSGKLLTTLSGHTGSINSAMFSPDGQRIVTASADMTARVWDLSGKLVRTVTGHSGSILNAMFSPDAQHVTTASNDLMAKVSYLGGESHEPTLAGHTGPVLCAVFSPDGRRIVTASVDGTARVWDLSGQSLALLRGHTEAIRSAVFSPDGHYLVTASDDKTARVWSLNSQEVATLIGHHSLVWAAAYSPDGQQIVTASGDKTARVWNLSGKELATLQGHTDTVTSAVFSPDGQRIVTASADMTARVWNLSGKELVTLTGHSDRVWNAVFSPDGQRIATASFDKTARVWDLSGKELATLTGHTKLVRSAVFSPDGQRILTASDDGTVRVWDLSGKGLATFQRASVWSAAFSPDGQRIVTASSDGVARVWDLSGKELATLIGHAMNQTITIITSAAFSPDGQYIVTASTDKTARVWDLSGKELATLTGHSWYVWSAAFSPDGRRVVTASADGTARQYLLRTENLLTIAACAVSRPLTSEEIQRFAVPTPLKLDFEHRQCPPELGR